MKRIVIFVIILMVLGISLVGCASSRRNNSELRSLMLQDNTRLDRNKAYYSKHNVKTRRVAYRKHRSYRM